MVNEFMFVHFKGNNDFTLLLIQISFRFANDNNYNVFFVIIATRRFQFLYVSDVYKWFAHYLCSAHTCFRADRQLKTEQRSASQNRKQSTKTAERERVRERGREKMQKCMWERLLGRSPSLCDSIVAAAFCFFDVLCFVYKYRLVNKC